MGLCDILRDMNRGERSVDIGARVVGVAVRHPERLQLRAETWKDGMKPQIDELYGSEVKATIDRFVENDPEGISRRLRWALEELRDMESIQVPGHEWAHIADTMAAIIYGFEEGNFSPGEKLEVILANALHDTGRAVEKVKNQPDFKDKAEDALFPILIGFRLQQKYGAIPEKLGWRILYAITSNSQPSTDYPTVGLVHGSDRLQLVGSFTMGRGWPYDVVMGKRRIMVPNDSARMTQIPRPNTDGDISQLGQYEFYMRCVFPAQTREGQGRLDEARAENAVILMLSTEGNEETHKQIFAPELGLVDKTHWSKKRLPEGMYESAVTQKAGFVEFLDKINLSPTTDVDGLMNLMNQIMKVEKLAVPDDLDQVMREKLGELSDQERINQWRIMMYTITKRHAHRVRDLDVVNKYLPKADKVSRVTAELVKTEFEDRERLYREEFPNLPEFK